MSGATQGPGTTSKLGDDKKNQAESQKEQESQQPALLEEDDEFEDFPVEGVSRCKSSGLDQLIDLRYRLDGRGEQSTRGKRPPVGGELG